jgi:hypothetical protein
MDAKLKNWLLLNKSIFVLKKILEKLYPSSNTQLYSTIQRFYDNSCDLKNTLKNEFKSVKLELIKYDELDIVSNEANFLASGVSPYRAIAFATAATPSLCPLSEVLLTVDKTQQEEIRFVHNNFVGLLTDEDNHD